MEYKKFEQSVIEAIQDCKSEIKHCCNNARYHIEKAWEIKDIDLEMAVFRGITAEEEAASAVFHCLKKHQYQNAEKIQFKQHPAKLGLYPFLIHIRNHLGETFFTENGPFENYRLEITEISKRKALTLFIKLKNRDLEVKPTPPLHFTISDPETKDVVMYNTDFKERVLEDTSYEDVLKYIKNIANQRNRLLYANSGGKPKVGGNVQRFLIDQKNKVFLYSYIVLLIDPWEKTEGSSSFVQQALDSYLLLLNRITEEEISAPPVNVV